MKVPLQNFSTFLCDLCVDLMLEAESSRFPCQTVYAVVISKRLHQPSMVLIAGMATRRFAPQYSCSFATRVLHAVRTPTSIVSVSSGLSREGEGEQKMQQLGGTAIKCIRENVVKQ